MQQAINLDKVFIEDIQKQFSTPNVKEALYQLLDFYKKSTNKDKLNIELQKRVESIDNGSEKLTSYMDGMDDMLERLKVKHANS